MQRITVRLIDIDFVRKNSEKILPVIDETRIQKANRFLQETDRLLSLGAGFLLSQYLPEKSFVFNENGKPYLKNGPFFNLSHSGDYAVLAVDGEREVGIDIQKIKEKDVSAIEYVSKEKLSLNEMFRLWSNKESLIKCLGGNISLIKDAPGLPLIGARIFKDESYYTQSVLFEGYSLSVTLKGNKPFEIVIEKADCDFSVK